MKINLPVFKDKDAKECSNLPEFEVGFNGVSTCRSAPSYPMQLDPCKSEYGALVWI